MNNIKQIEQKIEKRINFIQILLLVASQKNNKEISTDIFIKKHQENTKQEKENIVNFIRVLRIDQRFRREFHILSMKIFKRLQPSWTRKRIIYGRYSQLVEDYRDYFAQMNENNIKQFITQTFEYTLQSQTSTVMILLQTLFKYLRIKTECIIKSIIQKTQKQIQQKQTPAKTHPRRTYSLSKHKNIQTEYLQNTLPKQKLSLLVQQHSPFQGFYIIKPTRMKTTVDIVRNHFQKKQEPNKTSKRKIVDSFKQKTIFNQQYTMATTVSRHSATNQNSMINLIIPSKMYFRSFETVFSSQICKYLKLLDIQDIQQRQKNEISTKKKNQWMSKTFPKMLAEVCQRNQQIRKTLDIWIENISKK